ncbi:MAG TPA: DUF4339 domain-containing protein [Tepidisphaeraceae bacterium]|nr:DUF4339 domain-containing protein [Tepidisphaeraceae bacterium]
MNDTQWHYAQNNAQRGPVSIDHLKQMAASGQLRPADLVWQAGMAQWSPAGSVAGLFTGPPLPPPMIAPPPVGVAPATIGYYAAAPVAWGPPNLGADAGMRMLLPVGRSGWAIAAGYLGLLSLLLVPAPFALICSIIAIVDMKRHPEKHGMGRVVFGLIMGSLGTIALCFALFFAGLHAQ